MPAPPSRIRPGRPHVAPSRRNGRAPVTLALTILLACGGDDVTSPMLDELVFGSGEVVLESGAASVALENVGARALGPIDLDASRPTTPEGVTPPGVRIVVSPTRVPTLQPGASATLTLRLADHAEVPPATYSATLTARTPEGGTATMRVSFEVTSAGLGAVRAVRLDGPTSARRGDPVALTVELLGADGASVADAESTLSVLPAGAGIVVDRRLVAYAVGSLRVVARAGAVADTLAIEVSDREAAGRFEVRARGIESRRFTSDLWVHGNHAYLGTWSARIGSEGTFYGNTLHTWNVTGAPVRVDSDEVDARVVNDVKVRADGTLAVISHEGSNDARNGLTLLDLSNPADPEPIGRFTSTLEPGVHNLWIDGDVLYVVVDGAGGLRILDISDPGAPRILSSFYAGSSFLHDVYVRDGLAFLSHWNEGLIVLDVGNGIRGGSPANPVEVSRIRDLGGETHNAWYWPESGYVFVGEEDFGSEPGILHVVDFSDPENPREVATHAVPGDTPHNFWLDEDTGTLFAAWYGNGIRALDVTGTLLGDLGAQGREMGSIRYSGSGGGCIGSQVTCTWAPQLVGDRLFASDLNSGLVELEWKRER